MFKPIIDVMAMFDLLTWKVWFGQTTEEQVLNEVSSVSCKKTSKTSQRLNKQGLKRL